jgi:arylsulfatase A-like enzyme
MSFAPRVGPKVRNVLIYVLESVPAEYVEAYGGTYPVTPELNKYRQQAMLFKNIYAHAPATTKSMVSMLCAIYPWVSYQSLTAEHPTAKISSLTSELKARGYRTGFFSSSDNRFQGANKFLQARQFDVVEDFRSRQCDRARFVDPSGNRFFLNGMDDECAADSLIGWVGEKTDKPFMVMMWTMMTHYPYFLPGPETDYGVKDEYFNRYLNALHHGDYCFGKIMHALEERRLAESTLVVVVGDHGEAFGRHEQLTHASKIYEENLHVPLLLINPQLFKGEEASVLGGVMDITPTVMDLLQLPSAGDWQGRSLFSQDRSPRVYFFAPWSEHWFGYREGGRKYLFNATANRYEVYDLQQDPQETTNLAEQSPEVIEMIPQYLAAWVQYQNALIRRIIPPDD